MTTLSEYFHQCTEKVHLKLSEGELFAKILTTNDDSGRHGVLIPGDVYSFFPSMEIPDPTQNATESFQCCDVAAGTNVDLNYKYYQRYPERRVTKLSSSINDHSQRRLVIFLRGKTAVGRIIYLVDIAIDDGSPRFAKLTGLIFGAAITITSGVFIRREISAPSFRPDAALNELLQKFDDVRSRGWVPSLRAGTTGIGYTFESMLGIVENNDRTADFKGIEIKCKLTRERSAGGKTNLFQQAPEWRKRLSAIERIKAIGSLGVDQLYSCYSQVTTRVNNIGLRLDVQEAASRIDLMKITETLGDWQFSTLQKRLEEKHARAVFVKAECKSAAGSQRYLYKELVYCERPSIEQFVNLVSSREIVFEFLMSQKESGSVRNHGYPWRLVRDELREQLFGLQVKLR